LSDSFDPAAARPAPWRLERGANADAAGAVTFSVWCPLHQALALRLHDAGAVRDLPMVPAGGGVFTLRVADGSVRPGSDYQYVLPDVGPRPDPVSRLLPDGVHGPSRVVDPGAFPWSDAGWRGVAPSDLILYELHVGTFTGAGTFDGVRERLDHLASLGVTAVELMPVAAFPGARNWGYDGVGLYAPHVAYGGSDGMKRLVDACHAAGLAVVLDVVYNHLGPEGCYLADFGPYFSSRHKTPWGDALNFDGADSDDVRRFFIDNALYWLHEYHVDGLRLDAIHGIVDTSARHVLAELADAFHGPEGAASLGRRAFLIAESDFNDVKVIRPPERGGWGFDAQWSDDFHHALHALTTGARRGYFQDFGAMADLDKAVREGFVYSGQRSRHRRRRHGNSSAAEPGEKLVHYLQNHDQIANAYQGRRLATLVSAERARQAAMLLFTCPGLPMLFMGEETAESAPFHYFTSHGDPELVRAVRAGRHAEYQHLLDEGAEPGVWADPQDEATFRACRVDWDWDAARAPARAEMLRFYRELIALRRRLPALAASCKPETRVAFDEPGRWIVIERASPPLADGAAPARAVTLANLDPGEGDVHLRLPASDPAAPAPGSAASWRLALATRPGFPAFGAPGDEVAVAAGAAAIYVLAA
jgi:maltooligosyltrehalose trehalohydrolase